jgi:CRISPR system Cascade subunit CasE
LSALARYAGERGWTARRRRDGREADAGFDPDRALHHVLDETFGPSALKPFRLMLPRDRDTGSFYAYSTVGKDEMLARVAETAMPEGASGRILDLSGLDSKVMPGSWPLGRRLGFDVRVRPVVRIHAPLPNPRPGEKAYKAGAEVDAFVAEAQKAFPEGRPKIVEGTRTASAMLDAGRDRAAVYRDWLAKQVASGAEIDDARTEMVAFQRTRVSRGRAAVEGPDAVFHGELTITDPIAFQALLARGIGRHRSFGFGMLLLRPPRRR